MTDWARVTQALEAAGYPGFEFDSGDTAVPELSGEWVAGEIARDGGLKRENQPRWIGSSTRSPSAAPPSTPTRRTLRSHSATSRLDTGWRS